MLPPPFYRDPAVTLYQGDALDVLQTMEPESIHCVVTSPPFWGLRKYAGEQERVWGGDPQCSHQWGSALRPSTKMGHGGNTSGVYGGGVVDRGKTYATAERPPASSFCRLCGSWYGSYGLEPTPDCLGWARGERCNTCYVCHTLAFLDALWKVLRKDGTLWLDIGDSYASTPPGNKPNTSKDSSGLSNSRGNLEMRRAQYSKSIPIGLKPKDMVLIPQRIALAAQAAGWWMRSDIIWAKPNPMPESATDRPTSSYEHVLMLAKSGGPLFWTHRDLPGTRQAPSPDWRWVHDDTLEEVAGMPAGWSPKARKARLTPWARVNLWGGHDYYWDAEAVKEPQSPLTLEVGSHYQLGGSFHNSRKRTDAEEGYEPVGDTAGFRRYDIGGRNLRDVWTIATQPFSVRVLGGGIPYIVSPDCPVHGLHSGPDSGPTEQYGGQRGHYQPHIPDSGNYPERVPIDESTSIPSHGPSEAALTSSGAHKPGSSADYKTGACSNAAESQTHDHTGGIQGEHVSSLDSAHAESGDAATAHSTGSRRKGRVPATSPSYMLSAQSLDRTERSVEQLSFVEPSGHTPESNNAEGSSSRVEGSGPLARMSVRNAGKSCSCVIIDHFATFPEALPERCILAGSSERGVCAECGAPWARTMQKETIAHEGKTHTAYEKGTNAHRLALVRQRARELGNDHDNPFPSAVTLGWRPTCACDAGEPVPATVLDPFAGSGTSLAVAKRLGRHAIGIEVAAEYCTLAVKRIQAETARML